MAVKPVRMIPNSVGGVFMGIILEGDSKMEYKATHCNSLGKCNQELFLVECPENVKVSEVFKLTKDSLMPYGDEKTPGSNTAFSYHN